MALRKASSYSRKKARPYTRNSRQARKSYVKTIPGDKIAKYDGGDQAGFRAGKHKFNVRLISEEKVQVRDVALEAARMFVVKILDENVPGQYFIAVRVHPHHMQRENKSAGGMAGADRISSGMTQSFGQVIGRAAIIRPGQEIFFISCVDGKGARVARDALQDIKSKIPGRNRVVFENLEIKK